MSRRINNWKLKSICKFQNINIENEATNIILLGERKKNIRKREKEKKRKREKEKNDEERERKKKKKRTPPPSSLTSNFLVSINCLIFSQSPIFKRKREINERGKKEIFTLGNGIKILRKK